MAALKDKDIGILDDWDEQSKRVINMINIARISIFCSLLIFLAVIHNIRGTEQTLAAYAPMVRNASSPCPFSPPPACSATGAIPCSTAATPPC